MTLPAIQVFKPLFRKEEILVEMAECLDVGWTGMGFKTIHFEDAFKVYTGLGNAHFLSSATAGLELALKVLKQHYEWSDDSEVITTPLTFISSNHAILKNALIPTFADVDDQLCLDPTSIEACITPKTRAVMFVGLGGNVGQLEAVKSLCKEKNLVLILDAAHMAGTRIKSSGNRADFDQHVGHDVDVAVFSFQAVKNLPTADSGMICFADPALDAMARKLSWLGINKDTFARSGSEGSYKWDYDVEGLGDKSHGNSMMASMGLVGLKYLDADNDVRRRISAYYREQLTGSDGIELIEHSEDCLSSRHLCQIRVAQRDAVIDELVKANIYPGVHYKDNSCYQMYSGYHNIATNARELATQIVSLPLHLHLSDADLDRVVVEVKKAVRSLL